MFNPRQITPESYKYILPEERIAKYPLQERDGSKLLIYRVGEISHTLFHNIDKHLPSGSLVVLNETRVVHARLMFHKETGAAIEIFCLEPVHPAGDMQQAFSSSSPVIWKCLVGNAKKWKTGLLKLSFPANGKNLDLFARKIQSIGEAYHIEFSWDNKKLTFSEILQHAGMVPLPPYLNREAEEQDDSRYQTVFAKNEGSVAAPTAGLHLTNKVIKKLEAQKITFSKVTLHVSAGTFKPVNAPSIAEHEMHSEKIHAEKHFLETIVKHGNEPVIAVGTTTLRTIESLYWLGARYLRHGEIDNFHIDQWEPYQHSFESLPSRKEAYSALIHFLDKTKTDQISASTQVIIVPGYRLQVADILITNFHMPKSTLLMLVAAFIGDEWKDVYNYALNNDFRFLSYGDGCLFFRK